MKETVSGKFYIVIIIAFVIAGVLLHIFCSPPSFSYVERQFQRDKQQLRIIQEFLTNIEASTVIVEDDLTVIADLNKIHIEDRFVIEALSDLRQKGYTGINKYRDTIEFRLWENNACGCGIYYTFTGNSPSIQFVTETKSLPDENWHFYFSDYNEWRNSKT